MHLTIELPENRKFTVCDIPTLVETRSQKGLLSGIIKFPRTEITQSICNELGAFLYVVTSCPNFLCLIIAETYRYGEEMGLSGYLKGKNVADNDVPFVLRW